MSLSSSRPPISAPVRPIVTYSLLVLAAEALLSATLNRVGRTSPAAMGLMLAVMWTPALVGMAVALASARSLRGFGWKPGAGRYWALAYVFPLIYGGLALVAAQALGGGTINFERWAHGATRWGMPDQAIYGMLIQMTVFMLPGMVTGLGEEIGWRGFLAPRLASFWGFWGVVNVSFVIWFAFHVPGMLGGGYRGEGTPLWYSMLCFAGLLYPATVLMTWLRFRSGNLWPCVVAHAAHNCFIQVMWHSAFKPNGLTPWLLGEFGVLLPLISGAMVAMLVWKAGVPNVDANPQRADRSAGEAVAATA